MPILRDGEVSWQESLDVYEGDLGLKSRHGGGSKKTRVTAEVPAITRDSRYKLDGY